MQVDETGAPVSFTRATTTALTTLLDRLIEDAGDVSLSETRRGLTGQIRVLREPLGVVAAIVPWNAPVLAAATKLFPSLLMGCPTVLKYCSTEPILGVPPGAGSR